MENLLQHIDWPHDLRKLNRDQLPELASSLREFILETLSVKPGHLGASLGVVELTIALHHFYQTPEDLLIWDVGHQCYPHKILTGRKSVFDTLRQKNGISGFPAIEESEYDVFGTGHSSTSISAIVGMAFAHQLQGKTNKHLAVIGDASIVSGMAFEALNHLGSTDLDVTIILNDNSIGIDQSIGGLKKHFDQLTSANNQSLFEDFGLHYLGVIDGHNFEELFDAFEKLDKIKGPKLLHIKTTKGKGYAQAEADQVKWHAPGKFNKLTGEISVINQTKLSYQSVFGQTLSCLMNSNSSLVAITPAMISGSNLLEVQKRFPDRVFDVGIAEQHAVTFAAGLATQNTKPYLAIYSTFLQRAYDQLIHDVALQNLPVVFCVDRAGIVGSDGATHHGYFDISFLRQIPNMIVSAPSNAKQFQDLLYTAQFVDQPMSIRFPKGDSDAEMIDFDLKQLPIGKAYELCVGDEVAILSFGTIGERIQSVLEEIEDQKKFGHYQFLFCKPLDVQLLVEISSRYNTIISYEDGVVNGGFGSAVLEVLADLNFQGKFIRKGYPDQFIAHASVPELEMELGLDQNSIQKELENLL